MNAVYCVFQGAEGKAEVMDLCVGPVGQMLRRGEKVQELMSDRRGPLTDKWRDSPRPEGSRRSCATSTASVSAMEVGIIMTL